MVELIMWSDAWVRYLRAGGTPIPLVYWELDECGHPWVSNPLGIYYPPKMFDIIVLPVYGYTPSAMCIEIIPLKTTSSDMRFLHEVDHINRMIEKATRIPESIFNGTENTNYKK